jgi:hypothetical protein
VSRCTGVARIPHPKHSNYKVPKARPSSAERDERLKDGDVIERLPHALIRRPAIGARDHVQAMRIGGEP